MPEGQSLSFLFVFPICKNKFEMERIWKGTAVAYFKVLTTSVVSWKVRWPLKYHDTLFPTRHPISRPSKYETCVSTTRPTRSVILWVRAFMLQTCRMKGSESSCETRVPDLKVTVEVGRTFNLCGGRGSGRERVVGEPAGPVTGRIKDAFIIWCEPKECLGNYAPRPPFLSLSLAGHDIYYENIAQ